MVAPPSPRDLAVLRPRPGRAWLRSRRSPSAACAPRLGPHQGTRSHASGGAPGRERGPGAGTGAQGPEPREGREHWAREPGPRPEGSQGSRALKPSFGRGGAWGAGRGQAEGGKQPAPGTEWAEAAGTPTQAGDKGLSGDRLCARAHTDTHTHPHRHRQTLCGKESTSQTTDVDVGATLPRPVEPASLHRRAGTGPERGELRERTERRRREESRDQRDGDPGSRARQLQLRSLLASEQPTASQADSITYHPLPLQGAESHQHPRNRNQRQLSDELTERVCLKKPFIHKYLFL